METAKKSIWQAFKPSFLVSPAALKKPADMPVQEKPKEVSQYSYGYYNQLFSYSYTGEKNLGELGPVKDYIPNYDILRLRSWQAYYDSEIAQTVIKRYLTWVIGKGLKLQSEPATDLLAEEGITVDQQIFSKSAEGRYNLFKKSKRASFSGMKSLNKISKEAKKNAIVGGDVLVVIRYVKKKMTVQLIDGAHVRTPMSSDYLTAAIANGNKIINGIEINSDGQHVRYYVRETPTTYTPIEARGPKSGLLMAFMVYGLEYRLDGVRGIPLIAVVMETLKKMERYKEAALGSAEERAKLALIIQHDLLADGTNPFKKSLSRAFSADGSDDLPADVNGQQLADTVAVTTNKTAVNLPPGAKINALDSKNEIQFGEFYNVNIDIVCACVNIPPDVAMSKYTNSFSASRASLKDWENTIDVDRDDWTEQFEQPIYNFWLETKILENKVQAPGYLKARQDDNMDVIEAYQKARFSGPNVPHIDPLKEVNAIRAQLGDKFADLPLTSMESAAEQLGTGEYEHIITQAARELEQGKKLKIITEETALPAGGKKKKQDPLED